MLPDGISFSVVGIWYTAWTNNFKHEVLPSMKEKKKSLQSYVLLTNLSEIGNVIQRLKKRIHVTSSSLVFQSNITSFFFWVMCPVIKISHSHISLNHACIIHKITSTRIIQFSKRHEISETPITFTCIELVLCFCNIKKQWRLFFSIKEKRKNAPNKMSSKTHKQEKKESREQKRLK